MDSTAIANKNMAIIKHTKNSVSFCSAAFMIEASYAFDPRYKNIIAAA